MSMDGDRLVVYGWGLGRLDVYGWGLGRLDVLSMDGVY